MATALTADTFAALFHRFARTVDWHAGGFGQPALEIEAAVRALQPGDAIGGFDQPAYMLTVLADEITQHSPSEPLLGDRIEWDSIPRTIKSVRTATAGDNVVAWKLEVHG